MSANLVNLNFLAIFLIKLCVGLDLELDHWSACTFHLVHFYDRDLSESTLAANQYGQTWTVHNQSRELVKPALSGALYVEYASLHLRQSRVCNIHLLIQPKYKTWQDFDFGLWTYMNRFAVREGPTASMIMVSGKEPIFLPQRSRFYDLPMYIMYEYVSADDPDKIWVTRWICTTCPSERFYHYLPLNWTLNSKELTMHQKSHRNLQGMTVEVVWPGYSRKEKDVPCPTSFYFYKPHPVNVVRARYICAQDFLAVKEVVQRLNGTLYVKTLWPPTHKHFSTIQPSVARPAHPFPPVLSVHLAESSPLYINYCDFDKQRIRSDSNWVNPFSGQVWTLIILAALLGIVVSNLKMEDSNFKFQRSGLFNSFSLVQRQGSALNRLQILILIFACVVTGFYEIHLTSYALAPNPKPDRSR